MNRNNRESAAKALAALIALMECLYFVMPSSKNSKEHTKEYQKTESISNSISSEYVKEESELEQALITPKEDTAEENNGEQLSSDSEQLKESSPANTKEPQKIHYYHDNSMYYNKFIVYVNSEDFGARYYLFDRDADAKEFIEVNGLFTIPFDDITNCFTPINFITDEEHQILNNYGKIRSVDTILATLNEKYANKTNEEILKQIQSDAYNNVEYCIYDIILVNIKGENNMIALIDLGNGFYYEINGTQYYNKNELFNHVQHLEVLCGLVTNESEENRKKWHLCVNKINEICDSVNQTLNQEVNDKSRSLIK